MLRYGTHFDVPYLRKCGRTLRDCPQWTEKCGQRRKKNVPKLPTEWNLISLQKSWMSVYF